MAVLNGKLYFSWVQRSRLCIPDPTRNSAISKWQLALRKSNLCSALIRAYPPLFAVSVFSAPPCLRGGYFSDLQQNGGRL
jgi:hypothetical protein